MTDCGQETILEILAGRHGPARARPRGGGDLRLVGIPMEYICCTSLFRLFRCGFQYAAGWRMD